LLPPSLQPGRHGRPGLAAQLLDPCVDQSDEPLQRGVDEAEQARQRRDDRAEHLAPEHLRRGQRGELLDRVRADRLAVEHGALQAQAPGRARGLVERLRDGDHVAVVDECDRGRAG
jgi:hypothetical protein